MHGQPRRGGRRGQCERRDDGCRPSLHAHNGIGSGKSLAP
ncbi:hypothetical protein FM114_07075 [Luteococcus japonicus LSP_Lj1]|uniref:Uncharacterized protein n=1 Tax=Luteococcus japonicus LSP_Lj1 TaxID=1255658 RepID=A0A1R4JE34_9ACTN|nr:hypothetical protein FM114_07075 [Luteococcus japonicus LSP_Lj1]